MKFLLTSEHVCVAVFFLDPSGIRWELAHLPKIPMLWDMYKPFKVTKGWRMQHPE